jgi:hypothetical protein
MTLARLLFASSLVAVAQAGSRDNLDNVSSKLMVHVSIKKYALNKRKAEDSSGIPCLRNECCQNARVESWLSSTKIYTSGRL